MTNTTRIETGIARTLTIRDFGYAVNLQVEDTDLGKDMWTHLDPEHSTALASALLGENATVITDLPEVKLTYGDVTAGGVYRSENSDPAELMRHGKALLAMSAFLIKHNEEKEAAKAAEEAKVKAKEAANAKRRDELASELSGYGARYEFATELSQKAIDRIIELEEAAKV